MRSPRRTRRAQVAFKLDYAGGWGKTRTNSWKTFGTRAARTTARRSPGRSPRARRPTARTGRCRPGSGCCRTTASPRARQQAAWELRLSHWTGDLPVLTIGTDWAWHQWDHLYGTFTYAGQPVFGFKSTSAGNPLDTFGRNIYVDTFDSAYGTRLEAGEQLPRAQRHRRLLLQLQPARLAPGRQGRRSTAPPSKDRASRPT